MREHTVRPKARDEGLVVEELGDELLVYDRDRDVAHCLGRVAAQVWRSCDGEREIAQIGRLVSTPPDDRDALVADALVELQEKGLLVASSVAGDGRSKSLSRRQVVGRIAGALATPLIVSVVAPTVAAAQSGGAFCSQYGGGGDLICTFPQRCQGPGCCTRNGFRPVAADGGAGTAANCCSSRVDPADGLCVQSGCVTNSNECERGRCCGTSVCFGSTDTQPGICTKCVPVGGRCGSDSDCCRPSEFTFATCEASRHGGVCTT